MTSKYIYDPITVSFESEYMSPPTLDIVWKNPSGNILPPIVSPQISNYGFVVPSFENIVESTDDIYSNYEWSSSVIESVSIISQPIIFNLSSILMGDTISIDIYINDELKYTTTAVGLSSYEYSGSAVIEVPSGASITDMIMTTDDYFSLNSHTLPITLDGTELTLEMNYGNCCVPYYSKILTEDRGYVLAEEIKVGDRILAYDIKNESIGFTEVSFISSPKRDHIVKLTLEDGSSTELTKDHVIYTKEGWAAYCPSEVSEIQNPLQLQCNQMVMDKFGNYKRITNIEYIEYPDGLQCYNFSTGFRTYFSNDTLIHNVGCPSDYTQQLEVYIYGEGQSTKRYCINTPLETIWIKEGETIGSALTKRIGYIQGITRVDNYLLNGNVIDIDTYVPTENINLTIQYGLTQTSTTFVIKSETFTETGGGTIDHSNSKGYYDYYKKGSIVSGEFFGVAMPSSVRVSRNVYNVSGWSDSYDMVCDASLNNLYNSSVKYDIYVNNVCYATDVTRFSILGIDITESLYNSFPGSGNVTIRIEAHF